MDTELITKRLHISGLTPSITTKDLISRLSTFGIVKHLDGVGKLDGLGQPRKFGYVTLEGTKGQLAKCANVLSGSMWKGTKLRVGDARPDYKERIAKDLAADLEPPRKKRKHAVGINSTDMSLVTASNVSDRKGWKVTTMGRMVRPVRMRPERPLPPQSVLGRNIQGKAKKGEKQKTSSEKRKKIREPDTRARRRTIDPTRWDSVHLKGMFLDVVTAGRVPVEGKSDGIPDRGVGDGESGRDGSKNDEDSDEDSMGQSDIAEAAGPLPSTTRQSIASPTSPSAPTPTSLPQSSIPALAQTTAVSPSTLDTELTQEKAASLALLHSLSGTRKDADWVGQESVGSDMDEEEVERLKREGGRGNLGAGITGDQEVEEVPMDLDHIGQKDGGDEEDKREEAHEVPEQEIAVEQQVKAPVQMAKLKDLFAPREEEAGFSLLGHLDLDLELDDENDIPNLSQALPTFADNELISDHTTQQMTIPTSSSASQFTYDPALPLFFPLPSSFHPQTPRQTGRQKDMFVIARERGWDPLSAGFYRTESEDEIRRRWEESKRELTRGWKRRFREAGKVRRRRGGRDGD